MSILRNVTAGALIAVTPFTATVAAVRPNAAVPVSSTAASMAQVEDDRATPMAWLPIGIIVAAILLGIYFATSDKDDGQGNISRG